MMMNHAPSGMNYVPSGRYYGGTLMDGKLIPAGHADGVPFDGEHLLIEVDWECDTILWSLHGVGDDACWACSGSAWPEFRDGNVELVFMEPDLSGGSDLVPFFPVNPEAAQAYLTGLMTGLPNWPFEVWLPDSLRQDRIAIEKQVHATWGRHDALMVAQPTRTS
jgi:hypothetical protein